MSDLAPFVAAAIRDRVVEDMAKEIVDLKKRKEKELAPWTVTIHGPQPAEGAPKVYAWASVSMEHVLTTVFRRRERNGARDIMPLISVKNFEYTEHPFRWGDFLSSSVTVFCSQTSGNADSDAQQARHHHVSFDDDELEVGRGFGMKSKTEGQRVISKKLWVHWCWGPFHGNLNPNKCVDSAETEITIPIASEHLDRITPEFIGGLPLLRQHFLTMANEVADTDAPVRFVRVTLKAQGLVSLLTGDNSPESDSDDDDDEDDDEDVDHSSDDGDDDNVNDDAGNDDDMSIGV